jgi:hypothetical protein
MEVVYVFDSPIARVSGIVKFATQLVSSGDCQLFLRRIGAINAILTGKVFTTVSDNELLDVSDS